MKRGALLALALTMAGVSLARSQARRIDLRMTLGERGVVARRGEQAGGGGDPVRLVWSDGGTCDGRLGPFVDTRIDTGGVFETGLVADVRTCRPAPHAGLPGPVLAIVRPLPHARWPVALGADDPRAATAIASAQSAAATAGHLRGVVTWETPRVSQLGDAIYALVIGPACAAPGPTSTCAPRVAAVSRVRGTDAPELLLVRPAHLLWPREQFAETWFDWGGLVDVEGDGVVELVETQTGANARMVRLVRPSDRPEGDVVWLAHHEGDPFDATVDRPPRPVHAQ